jgi:hypothetical protein
VPRHIENMARSDHEKPLPDGHLRLSIRTADSSSRRTERERSAMPEEIIEVTIRPDGEVEMRVEGIPG